MHNAEYNSMKLQYFLKKNENHKKNSRKNSF